MAVESVTGPLISSSLQFLFERIGSGEVLAYLQGKSKKECDFEELVGRLKVVLNSVLAVIEDAEKKRSMSRSATMWLDDLRDSVLDAEEDLLDWIEFDAMVQQKEKSESSAGTSKEHNALKKNMRNVFSTSHCSKDGDMETKVKKLLERFDGISTQKNGLGLEMDSVQKASWTLSSMSFVDDSKVYSRDNDNGALLVSHDGSNEKICVISIVGMGGLGKTNLAQSVYNDKKLKRS